MLPTSARLFRIVAVAEAASWLGLLVGMLFKYVVVHDEIGVQVFGPIHGVLFLVYLVVTVVAARTLGWGRWALALGLVASVPPLATLAFERWATRTGRLGRESVATP